MPNYLAQVILNPANGLAEDACVNTFAFSRADAADQADLNALVMDLAAFYNNANTGSSFGLAKYISPSMSRAVNGNLVKVYDITGNERAIAKTKPNGDTYYAPPASGSPVDEQPWALAAGGVDAVGLPEEVAVCLSLRSVATANAPVEAPDGTDANPAPDRPKSRTTGRLYFGPLGSNALGYSGGKARVPGQLRNELIEAAQRLGAGAAADGWTWSIWSRADGILRAVDTVAVDDAYDTQRRRGSKRSVVQVASL